MFEGLREAYRRDGFVVVRGLLEVEEAMALRQRLVEHSGVTDADFDDVEDGVPRKWTSPAGVAQVPAFQHLLVDERLVGLAREVLGPEAVYLHHNGCMQATPRRDGIAITSTAPSVKVKTGTSRPRRTDVHASRCTSNPRRIWVQIWVDPGSHRRESRLVRWERRAPRFSTVRRMVMGQGLAFARARWIATEPGDVVIFDHRVLHCGGRTRGPKYSIYLGAGIQNVISTAIGPTTETCGQTCTIRACPRPCANACSRKGCGLKLRFLSSSTSSTPSFRRRHDGGFLTSSPTTLKGVEAKARA